MGEHMPQCPRDKVVPSPAGPAANLTEINLLLVNWFYDSHNV